MCVGLAGVPDLIRHLLLVSTLPTAAAEEPEEEQEEQQQQDRANHGPHDDANFVGRCKTRRQKRR